MRCSSTSSRCASCSRPTRRRATRRRARRAAAAAVALGSAAGARRRRLRRLARRARRDVRRSARRSAQVHVRRAAIPRAAASATGTWRCSTIRTTCTACSRRYFREAGGQFDGGVQRRPRAARRSAVRDARIAAALRHRARRQQAVEQRDGAADLPDARDDRRIRRRRRPRKPRETVKRWLASRGLAHARARARERLGAVAQRAHQRAAASRGCSLAADASAVREEFASSLAVAAIDGTVQRRFQNGTVAGQALLKTGSLEGVRALAGYVIDADGPALDRRRASSTIRTPARGAAGARLSRAVGVSEWRDVGPVAAEVTAVGFDLSSRKRSRRRSARRVRRPAGRGQAARSRRRPADSGGPARGVPDPQESPASCRPSWRRARRPSICARLIDAAIDDDAERRRALTRLALLETALEARGGPCRDCRAPRGYYDRIVERFSALTAPAGDPRHATPGIALLSLN